MVAYQRTQWENPVLQVLTQQWSNEHQMFTQLVLISHWGSSLLDPWCCTGLVDTRSASKSSPLGKCIQEYLCWMIVCSHKCAVVIWAGVSLCKAQKESTCLHGDSGNNNGCAGFYGKWEFLGERLSNDIYNCGLGLKSHSVVNITSKFQPIFFQTHNAHKMAL